VGIEGVTLLDSQTWTLMLWGCRNVSVENVRTIGFHGGDDGIDIVSSRNVTMRGCFTRTKDDCVAVKAFPFKDVQPQPGQFDVADVLIEKCVFWNAEWGNALEIGYETRTETISNVTFRDCDVIRCEREGYTSGGTLTIHNGDRAHVRDVLYENIRVEDSREKLIDFKIAHTRYSRDEQRGQISGITLRDIDIVDGPLPVSIIQGFDAEHMIRQVTIEKLRYRGRMLTDALEAKMVLEVRRYDVPGQGRLFTEENPGGKPAGNGEAEPVAGLSAARAGNGKGRRNKPDQE
jgi:polygalacturonase